MLIFPQKTMPRASGTESVPALHRAFTLVELLVVTAIIITLMVLIVPAMNPRNAAAELTKASYDIAGILERARAQAMAQRTYVWVGFHEEDATQVASTPGKGRVLLATVASNDGTRISGEADPAGPLDPDRLRTVERVSKIENIHLIDLGSPSSADPGELGIRSDSPYTYGDSGNESKYNRISSESDVMAKFPFSVGNHTFSKMIMFTPRGEANVVGPSGEYTLRPVIEIGLRPTHGNTVDTTTPNVAAIQLTGIGGRVDIYRP